ncbi:O-acetylhomoserine (thiol)-lyase [Streptohalobacillus salinus]|uniref:O-succinylhomoserine sulfhydrylase n=1 Tax=Streptohalobacillus salinus TaxID=621096 RepID=A0A2V3WH30_9BACI|nr:PLP-dependent aspartate aminotransferase family protein [Streptohalobacillus salinus]PXW93149.1 O-acetylhomoserine (thiol)-lyase [Streptohalobacillus salinus]
MSESTNYQSETLALHGGTAPDPTTGARAVPIYQSTSFVFENTTHAEQLFSLDEPGHIYSRIGNPTVEAFEKRIALLEEGVQAVAVSSGMAAITLALLNLAGSGDEIIATKNLYGGTYNLFKHTLPRYGITVHFIEPDQPEAITKLVNANTKAVFAEIIGNPNLHVLDVAAYSEVAHENGLPLIVDNTFATPHVIKPIQHGADIVVHSLTKWIGGHGTTIGGVIIDGGQFDWATERFNAFTEPDPSYNNIVFHDAFGSLAYGVRLRVQLLRDFGSCLSADSAFRFIQGLETLALRIERHNINALKIARYLLEHEAVEWVNYPGLPVHPSHTLSKQQFKHGFGSVITFGVKGGKEAGVKLIEAVALFSHVANVGDAKSLIIHPASTTHQQLSEADLAEGGISGDLVRLSIGLEHVDDLIRDLDQALSSATGNSKQTEIVINDEGVIKRALKTSKKDSDNQTEPKTIAVVGLSGKETRPSYRLARKMQRLGYRIIPVNPRETEVLGEKSYPDLLSIDEPVDIVQVFRKKEAAVGIAKEAIQLKPEVFWLQEGVVSDEACELVKSAGINVVHNRCTYKEAQRLRGSVVTYSCDI